MRPVRRRPHFVSITVFSVSWGLCVLFLALPFTASAAPVTYETVRVGPGQYAPNGVTSPVTVNVKSPGVSRYHQIVPVATPNAVMKMGVRLIRGGGVGIAISAAVEGLGYLIDQATGEIKKIDRVLVEDDPYPLNPNYVMYSVAGGTGYHKTRESACRSKTTVAPNWQFISVSGYTCTYQQPYGISDLFLSVYNSSKPCYPPAYKQGSYCVTDPVYEDNIIDLDPSDWQRIENKLNTALSLAEKMAIIKQALSAANLAGTLNSDNYPVTLTGNSSQQQLFNDWPQFQQLLQNLLNAEIAAYLSTVQPDFEVSPDDQVIVDTGSDFLPPDFTPPTLELPAFCEWASFICEPFVGGDQPDVPMLDLEAPDYDSGLPTGGTCPQPYTFSTAFTGPMEISFQPACDLATAIRLPLLAISYLMAGFIVVGVRR